MHVDNNTAVVADGHDVSTAAGIIKAQFHHDFHFVNETSRIGGAVNAWTASISSASTSADPSSGWFPEAVLNREAAWRSGYHHNRGMPSGSTSSSTAPMF